MSKYNTLLKKIEKKLKLNSEPNIVIFLDDIPQSDDEYDYEFQADVDYLCNTEIPQELINQLIKENNTSDDVLFLDIEGIKQFASIMRLRGGE